MSEYKTFIFSIFPLDPTGTVLLPLSILFVTVSPVPLKENLTTTLLSAFSGSISDISKLFPTFKEVASSITASEPAYALFANVTSLFLCLVKSNITPDSPTSSLSFLTANNAEVSIPFSVTSFFTGMLSAFSSEPFAHFTITEVAVSFTVNTPPDTAIASPSS